MSTPSSPGSYKEPSMAVHPLSPQNQKRSEHRDRQIPPSWLASLPNSASSSVRGPSPIPPPQPTVKTEEKYPTSISGLHMYTHKHWHKQAHTLHTYTHHTLNMYISLDESNHSIWRTYLKWSIVLALQEHQQLVKEQGCSMQDIQKRIILHSVWKG